MKFDAPTGNNPIDRMTSLVSVGEVLPARVLRVGVPGGKGWQLGTLDVDDDEPLAPAPALLPGGPPWLRPALIGQVGRVEQLAGDAQPLGDVAFHLGAEDQLRLRRLDRRLDLEVVLADQRLDIVQLRCLADVAGKFAAVGA